MIHSQSAGQLKATRRLLLKGMLGTYCASLVPWALAQPVDEKGLGAFSALSALIAGRQSLNSELSRILYRALVEDDPQFDSNCRTLLATIEQRQLPIEQLQSVLDTENSAQARVPRQVAQAWFLGVVGEGKRARCLAYEHALNAEFVADHLRPPTYCYGEYGSWSKQPV